MVLPGWVPSSGRKPISTMGDSGPAQRRRPESRVRPLPRASTLLARRTPALVRSGRDPTWATRPTWHASPLPRPRRTTAIVSRRRQRRVLVRSGCGGTCPTHATSRASPWPRPKVTAASAAWVSIWRVPPARRSRARCGTRRCRGSRSTATPYPESPSLSLRWSPTRRQPKRARARQWRRRSGAQPRSCPRGRPRSSRQRGSGEW
mmetsp:Transcript_65218/g.181292  ORF Transcript_65218/g.181292 Transcript_65218/m.181292 type:complete len:205 (-) Transcript_65218:1101-1715(-)